MFLVICYLFPVRGYSGFSRDNPVRSKGSILTSPLKFVKKVPKPVIVEKVAIIAGTEYLFIPDKAIILEALMLYAKKNIDYIDAYNAVFISHYQTSEILSYDEDFDVLEGITRIMP